MKNLRQNNLFGWTLRGKPYGILAAGSLAFLILAMGVM